MVRSNNSKDKGSKPARREPTRFSSVQTNNQKPVRASKKLGRPGQKNAVRLGTLEHAPDGLKSEVDRRKRRNRRILRGIIFGGLAFVLLALLGGFAYLKFTEKQLNTSMHSDERLNLDLSKRKADEPYNVLILGYDKRPKETSYRTDTMLLARIDPKQGTVMLLSLPRDYRVNLVDHGKVKLNSAFVYGGEELTVKTVEELTGQKIHHFMGVNFQGFKAIVDSMGGVEIDVKERFDDPKADSTKGKTASKIDKGLQKLDGDHAMTFVRSRNFAEGDFARMRHQQQFLKAVADQAATSMTKTQLVSTANAMVPYLDTDMKLTQLLQVLNDLKSVGSRNLFSTTLPGKWVSPFIVPDEEAKAQILEKFSKGEPFELSADEKVKVEAEKLSESSVSLVVRNGTTRLGIGKQAAAIMRARGFTVAELGNTDNQTVYDTSYVVYKKSRPAAELVASYLQPTVKIVESRGMYNYDGEILLVVGRDWDVEKVPVAEIKTGK